MSNSSPVHQWCGALFGGRAERLSPGAHRVPVKLFVDSSLYVGEIWRDKRVSVLGRYLK